MVVINRIVGLSWRWQCPAERGGVELVLSYVELAAEEDIGLGRQLQLLRPSEFGSGNEHYYLNLFGRALNKEVCSHCQYDQSGAHPTLAGRPNHFAPLYAPRYDEATTLALRGRSPQAGA